jgi:glycosyltransferase involved in cell wall biosynthesis
VAQVPPQRAGVTRYLTLLGGALQDAGVEVITPCVGDLWHLGWTREVDVVHLHWLEFIAPSASGGVSAWARTLIRHVRLIMLLAWLRIRGIRLVWTVHNLRPHEPVWPRLESLLSLTVSQICHALIAHSAYARDRIRSRWGRTVEVTVIPHGNYVGLFAPPPATREELRAAMAIPEDAYVFLAFGQVRPYKCLPDLVTAFRASSGGDARLLIVGKPVVADEARRLHEAADADNRVLLDLREVPDADVSGLHRCADAAVLAYRDVFSSGALLLALSLGLPVVAPDHGTAAEIAGTTAGELFAPGELAAALDRSRAAHRTARADAAHAVAEQYGWDRVGREAAALYGRLTARSPSRPGPSNRRPA